MQIINLTRTVDCPVCHGRHDTDIDMVLDEEVAVRYGVSKCGRILFAVYLNELNEAIQCSLTIPDIPPRQQPVVFASHVKAVVCNRIGAPEDNVECRCRDNNVVLVRMFTYAYVKMRFPMITLKEIGNLFAHKPDHATIIHAFRSLRLLLVDPVQRKQAVLYNELKVRFGLELCEEP